MSNIAEQFRNEYLDLKKRITDIYNSKIDAGFKVVYYNEDFEDDGEVSDDYIPMYGQYSECPSTYYIDNNGDTIEVYVTAIDKDGIHIVEYHNPQIALIIDLSELDGVYAMIDVLEMLC